MEPYIILIGLGPFLLAALIVVQILLSKNDSPLFGWIMPLLCFLLSLFFSFGTYRDTVESLPVFGRWSIATLLLLAEFLIVRHFKKRGAWDPPVPPADSQPPVPEEAADTEQEA